MSDYLPRIQLYKKIIHRVFYLSYQEVSVATRPPVGDAPTHKMLSQHLSVPLHFRRSRTIHVEKIRISGNRSRLIADSSPHNRSILLQVLYKSTPVLLACLLACFLPSWSTGVTTLLHTPWHDIHPHAFPMMHSWWSCNLIIIVVVVFKG